MIVCLIGARYRDFYQLVPIGLQLVFLLSDSVSQRQPRDDGLDCKF